ncbi:MAG: magnesium transporter [Candidatus Obscuribacterales bacterium]|nr:magnesium transporter [Candidatus Obscuribacterales bacterium]
MTNITAAVKQEQLTALIDSGERQRLRMLLNDQHPADLAECLQELDPEHRLSCFRLLDLDNASAVLAELDTEHQRSLLKDLGDIGVVTIISSMAPDDAADLLAELPEEKASSIISQMADDEEKAELVELLSFKDDSAGGIMSTDYLAVNASMRADEALVHLRETYKKEEEEIYDLFVVDADERLVGWLSVKELLMAPADATVESLMDTNLIQVSVDTDQEEAAEKIQKYDLLSLPVVDKEGRLRGIITADDAIDVIEEEADEDIYQSSGIDVTDAETSENLGTNVRQAFRARIPWLVVTLIIESGSAMVITHFDQVIKQTVIAASFMPLLTSLTGSVAMQSTCITLRSQKRQFAWKHTMKNVWHEARVGALLGIACGIMAYLLSCILRQQGGQTLGIVVGVSLFITMSTGVLIGTLIPVIFERIGIEPAHASGPLITSLLDVCTMTIYLSIVHAFLSHIV